MLSLINTGRTGNMKTRRAILFNQWYPVVDPTFYNYIGASKDWLKVNLLVNFPTKLRLTFSNPNSAVDAVSQTL